MRTSHRTRLSFPPETQTRTRSRRERSENFRIPSSTCRRENTKKKGGQEGGGGGEERELPDPFLDRPAEEHEEAVGAEGGVVAGQVDRGRGPPASLALHRFPSRACG